MPVGRAEEASIPDDVVYQSAMLFRLKVGIVMIRAFREPHYMHRRRLRPVSPAHYTKSFPARARTDRLFRFPADGRIDRTRPALSPGSSADRSTPPRTEQSGL